MKNILILNLASHSNYRDSAVKNKVLILDIIGNPSVLS